MAGFLDDDSAAVLATRGRLKRLGPLDAVEAREGKGLILAVGALESRRRLLSASRGWDSAVTIVASEAYVSETVELAPGVFVGVGAVVQSHAVVGAHAIINTSAVVEHECRIGENSHVAPGAVLGGRVVVGADTLVGLGSRVLPGVRIGSGCVIGAGAVVHRDVRDGATVVGVPAKELRKA